MILFWIALGLVLIALSMGIVMEFISEHREYKERLNNQAEDAALYESWLDDSVVSNLDVQHRIQHYSADKPL